MTRYEMDESVREDLVDQGRRAFVAAVFGDRQQPSTDGETPEQESSTPEEEHSALVAHLFGAPLATDEEPADET
jgi:hypothetical protein